MKNRKVLVLFCFFSTFTKLLFSFPTLYQKLHFKNRMYVTFAVPDEGDTKQIHFKFT